MKSSTSHLPAFGSRHSPLSPRTGIPPVAGHASASASITSLGMEGAEDMEMIKALKSPLMIQTPLQVILETFWDKLRTQTELNAQLQERVRKLEKFQVDGHELTDRVRMAEERLQALSQREMPDIDPADVYRRLDEMAATADKLHEAMTEHSLQHEQHVEPRLAVLEQRLAGTFNLAGHMIAVADMAAELGVPLPDFDATGSLTVGAALGSQPAGAARDVRAFTVAPTPVAMAEAGTSSSSSSGSSTRLAALQRQLEAAASERRELVAQLQDVRFELGGLDQALAEAVHNSGSRFALLEESNRAVGQRLAEEAGALRHALQHHGEEMSYSELVKLQRQVEALAQQAGDSAAAVQELRERELARLREGMEALQRQVSGAAGVREVDQVLAARLQELRAELEAIRGMDGAVVVGTGAGVQQAHLLPFSC